MTAHEILREARAGTRMSGSVRAAWWMLLIGGLAIAFVTPPMHSPDESVHFFRAYAISEGHFTPERRGDDAGSELPCDLPRLRDAMRDGVAGNPEVRMPPGRLSSWRDVGRPSLRPPRCFVSYKSAAVYTPVTYVPIAIAIRAARMVDASLVEQLFVVRITSLVLSWLLTGLAISIAPSIAWSLLAISALPMEAFLRATHVSDSLVGALVLVIVACIVRALEDGRETGAVALLAAALLCLSKPLYLFLPFLVLLPGRAPADTRRRLAGFALLLIVAILALSCSRAGYVPPSPASARAPAEVAGPLLRSPASLARLSATDIVRNMNDYRMGFVGDLGLLDAPVPRATSLVLLGALLAVVVLESRADIAPPWMRATIMSFAIASIVLIQLSIFVSWTHAGAREIVGVQGRYFLPIAPPLFLVIPGVGASRRGLARIVGMAFVPSSLVVTIAVLATRYWA